MCCTALLCVALSFSVASTPSTSAKISRTRNQNLGHHQVLLRVCVCVCASVCVCVCVRYFANPCKYIYIPCAPYTYPHKHWRLEPHRLSLHNSDTITHRDILRHTATRCDTRRHSAAQYSPMQHNATHMGKYKRILHRWHMNTATHCDTLHHTATHTHHP